MEHQDYRAESDQGLWSSIPPSGYERVQEWVLSEMVELSTVRQQLRAEIRGVDGLVHDELADVPEKMILVASELATNALEHGRPPTIVTLKFDGTCYLLEVADHDPDTAPLLAGRRAPGAGGFGLQIARRVGQEVGWFTTGTTKHIWVTFPARVESESQS